MLCALRMVTSVMLPTSQLPLTHFAEFGAKSRDVPFLPKAMWLVARGRAGAGTQATKLQRPCFTPSVPPWLDLYCKTKSASTIFPTFGLFPVPRSFTPFSYIKCKPFRIIIWKFHNVCPKSRGPGLWAFRPNTVHSSPNYLFQLSFPRRSAGTGHL